jgi:hypothetical protein
MADTLANSGAPASPAPAPSPASSSSPAPGIRPSAPASPRSTGYSPARDRYEQIRATQDQARGEAPPGDQPALPLGDSQTPPADAGAKVKVGRYEIDERALGEMMQRQAADDLRKAKLPPSADAYKLEISRMRSCLVISR